MEEWLLLLNSIFFINKIIHFQKDFCSGKAKIDKSTRVQGLGEDKSKSLQLEHSLYEGAIRSEDNNNGNVYLSTPYIDSAKNGSTKWFHIVVLESENNLPGRYLLEPLLCPGKTNAS